MLVLAETLEPSTDNIALVGITATILPNFCAARFFLGLFFFLKIASAVPPSLFPQLRLNALLRLILTNVTAALVPYFNVPLLQDGRLFFDASDMMECALTFLPDGLRSSILPNFRFIHDDLPCSQMSTLGLLPLKTTSIPLLAPSD
jgi:hypothetical protein